MVVLVGAAGCGGDTATSDPTTTGGTQAPKTEPPATSAPTSTTTAPMSTDEAEVRAVIDRYWEAWFEAAGNPPNPTHPELNALLTGEAAVTIIGGIERRAEEGTFVGLPEPSLFARQILSVTFDKSNVATVTECVVDDSQAVDLATGEVVRSGLATLTFVSTLNEFPEGWRMTTSKTIDKADGVATCPDA